MIRRLLISAGLLIAGLAHAACTDCAGSAGYVVVTVAASLVDEVIPFISLDLDDLPVEWWDELNTAGDTTGESIRVTASDGTTELPVHVVVFDGGADTGRANFLATGLSASVDTDYWIWGGNPSATMYAATDTYGRNAVYADYEIVYTMEGGTITDVTGNHGDATLVNTPTTAQTGPVASTSAVLFDDASSEYLHDDVSGMDWPISIETWTYLDTAVAKATAAALSSTASSIINYMYVWNNSMPRLAGTMKGGSGSESQAVWATAVSTNTWYYHAITRDDDTGTTTIWNNGVSRATNATTVVAPSWNKFAIGALYDSSVGDYFSGKIGFSAVSLGAHSANYWSTSYAMWTNASFSSAGAFVPNDSCTSGSTGWVLFQTAANDATGGDTAWTNVTNALVDDSNTADATSVAAGDTTDDLELTDPDYGTTVPTTADSYTVSFRVKRIRESGSGKEILDDTIQAIVGGTPTGDDLSDVDEWTSAANTVDYVSTYAWTGTEFDADLGISIRGLSDGVNSATASIYVAWIKVDWTCGDAAANTRGFFALTE